MSNTTPQREIEPLRASTVAAYLAARGLPKAWCDKMTEIIKVGSGGASDAAIDNLDTVREILTMSVPLMKRQLKAVDVIMELLKATVDFEAEPPKVLPFANILEETDDSGFLPAPRALSPVHLAAPEFKKLLAEMGERALFDNEKVELVETANADGSYSWTIVRK